MSLNSIKILESVCYSYLFVRIKNQIITNKILQVVLRELM